jgi:L-iditol 2-dehydrogenase
VLVRRMNEVYPRAINLVRHGQIDVESIVTGRYPLERVDEAFKSAATRAGLKVITTLRPSGPGS